MLIAISCMDQNGLIGINDSLPWKIPQEMAHFKETIGNWPIVIGSSTLLSFKVPFTFAPTVVISRDSSKIDSFYSRVEPYLIEHNLDYELIQAEAFSDALIANEEAFKFEKAFLVGGRKVYEELLLYCDQLILTVLNSSYSIPEGSTPHYFPVSLLSHFEEVEVKPLFGLSNIEIGKIFYLKNKTKIENIFSFQKKKKASLQEIGFYSLGD